MAVELAIPEAVIFDMDGVLADSGPYHFIAFQKLGDHIGVPFLKNTLDETHGMHNRQILPYWLNREMTSDEIAQLADLKEKYYREFVTSGDVKPVVGVDKVLVQLRQRGIPLAVGSSGPKENVELILDTFGIRSFFKSVISGSDTSRAKPFPDIFLAAAQGLNVQPHHCWVVEDAVSGIRAARTAGMTALGITTTTEGQKLKEAGALKVFDSMEQIQAFIAAMTSSA